MSSRPGSPPPCVDEATLTLQLQQFLDDWFYRILHSPLGKRWDRRKSISVLLDVFQLMSITFSSEEREELVNCNEDQSLTTQIVTLMSQEVREQFDSIALQIQTVMHEASRIMSACEQPGDDVLEEIFSESLNGGMKQEVLRSAVVHAAREVAQMRKVHVSWRASTDNRIDRLLRATEESQHAMQQLLAVEAQLAEYKDQEKGKAKHILLNMAEGQDQALMHSVFSSWLGLTQKTLAEQEIRKKFEDQIARCEAKLFRFKEAQIANVRGVVMRMSADENDNLMRLFFRDWSVLVAARKEEGDTVERLKAAQDKLNSLEAAQKESVGKFMTRMASGSDMSLKNLCLEAWIHFHEEYALQKEYEDRVKQSEKAFKEHIEAKKDEAKIVLDRMLASSAGGLLTFAFQHWTQFVAEEKKAAELQHAVAQSQSKFKSLNARQKAGAHGVQSRVNEQVNLNLLQRVVNNWVIETKVSRFQMQCKAKYDNKKRQLQGVQMLFKSFAMQLDQNLGQDDDTQTYRSTARWTHRKSTRGKKTPKGIAKGDGCVSLPDIHMRPCVA